MKRTLSCGIALLWAAIPLRATLVSFTPLSETAKAPVLVTGQVIAVEKSEPAAKESVELHYETWWMTVEIRVLRSNPPIALDRIRLRFLQYAPNQGFASPIPLPGIETGQTLVFPLRGNEDPFQPWRLVADKGMTLTLPAHDELEESAPPANARAFLLRELANAIAHGTRSEIFAMSGYLQWQHPSIALELLSSIESQVGDDRDRWADIATGIIAGTGVPRPTFAELRSSQADTPPWAPIVRTALLKLGASPETDILLIQKLLANAPINAWGSAGVLIEFGDNPVLIESLRKALRDDVSGSCEIASALAHIGHTAVLDDALPRAVRVLSQPVRTPELQGAASLLRDFGSDAQLQQLAALARKYETADRDFYSSLWQFSVDNEHPPRNARVLEVALGDREPIKGINGMRVCDFAVGILARAVGEKFKDVTAARAWLDAHHIPR